MVAVEAAVQELLAASCSGVATIGDLQTRVASSRDGRVIESLRMSPACLIQASAVIVAPVDIVGVLVTAAAWL